MSALQLEKKSKKEDRRRLVLFSLIEEYIRTGKPIGSHTLKEVGPADLSSATIRNYFAELEEEGYLMQLHSSGGRIPTHSAFRLYAQESLDFKNLSPDREKLCKELRSHESREIVSYLQQAAEALSAATNSAVFLSAPRFDQDFIREIKLVGIDHARCLCILITDFGVIQTEILPLSTKLSSFTLKHMEDYFRWRLTKLSKPESLDKEAEELAHKIYNELMVRYLVGYSNFTDEEIYRTGFSKLLHYPEFQDLSTLASGLALFENSHSMRLLLKECAALNSLKYWIGSDLSLYTTSIPECAVFAVPYCVHQQAVGAIGLLGPVRTTYKENFALLQELGASLSETITRNIYKFKIKYRHPKQEPLYLAKEGRLLLENHRGVV